MLYVMVSISPGALGQVFPNCGVGVSASWGGTDKNKTIPLFSSYSQMIYYRIAFYF